MSEGGPVIGSLITVVPPGGYTAANPITVDITYGDGEVPISAVCKSRNGKPPFTQLPACTFPEIEGAPPDIVPCWDGEVRAFMTSQDPAFTGH